MFQPASSDSFDPFLMLPRNDRFLRGQARFPAIPNRSQFVWIGLLLLFGLAFALIAAADLITDGRLQQSGVTTQGMVVSRRVSGGKSTSYYITYRFPVNDAGNAPVFYAREQQVSRDSYNRHPEQTAVSVAYLKADPTVSKLTGKDTDDSSRNSMLVVGAIWFTILGVMLAFMVRPILKDRWLAQHGEIIEGQVVNCSGRMTSGKGKYYRLTMEYQFCTPDGRIVFGRQNASRNDLRHSLLPTQNAPVAVLYVDDRNYKLL